MDPITNVDRLVLILRQKLEERQRASQSSKKTGQPTSVNQSAVSRFGTIAAIDGVDERQLRRTFIQTLLADQLGEKLVNDAQFQQVVSRVTEAVEEDSAASKLLSRLLSEVRAR